MSKLAGSRFPKSCHGSTASVDLLWRHSMNANEEKDLNQGQPLGDLVNLESVHNLFRQSPVSLDWIHDLFRQSIDGAPNLTLLKGFKLNFSGNQDFHKVFFSARCECGTAALLSVEVAKSKTHAQVEENLPTLRDHLMAKVHQFKSMPCEMHQKMRMGGGPKADTKNSRGEG